MMCSRGCGRQAGWSQCVSLVRAACSGCVGSPNRSLQWLTNGSKFMAGLWGAGERSSSRMRTPLNARRLEGLTPRFLESQVLYLPCGKRGKRPKNLARNLYQLSCDDVTIVDMICGMVWQLHNTAGLYTMSTKIPLQKAAPRTAMLPARVEEHRPRTAVQIGCNTLTDAGHRNRLARFPRTASDCV